MTLLCELHLPFFPSHQSLQFVRGNHLFRDKGKGKEDKEKGKEDKDNGKERQIQKQSLPSSIFHVHLFNLFVSMYKNLQQLETVLKSSFFPPPQCFSIACYTISILGCLDGPSSTDMCSQFIISKTGSPEVGLDVKLKRFSRGPGAIYNWSLLTFK